MKTDQEYLELLLSPLRAVIDYRPRFGQTAKGGVSASEFQKIYSADPFYHWLGLDAPEIYTAHRVAGGLTSLYRQIRDVVGYDLQGLFERNQQILRERVREALLSLLQVEGKTDARTLTPLNGNTYDLVITSPPYANRISYIRELRPYMYWLGFLTNGAEAGELDWKAIGGTWGVATSRLKLWQPQLPVSARVADIASRIRTAHPTNGVLMANYVVKYFEDMRLHIQRLTELLASGATIHYIVGNSSFYGVLVPVEQILAEFFAEQGFSSVGIVPVRKRNCKKELCEFEIVGRL